MSENPFATTKKWGQMEESKMTPMHHVATSNLGLGSPTKMHEIAKTQESFGTKLLSGVKKYWVPISIVVATIAIVGVVAIIVMLIRHQAHKKANIKVGGNPKTFAGAEKLEDDEEDEVEAPSKEKAVPAAPVQKQEMTDQEIEQVENERLRKQYILQQREAEARQRYAEDQKRLKEQHRLQMQKEAEQRGSPEDELSDVEQVAKKLGISEEKAKKPLNTKEIMEQYAKSNQTDSESESEDEKKSETRSQRKSKKPASPEKPLPRLSYKDIEDEQIAKENRAKENREKENRTKDLRPKEQRVKREKAKSHPDDSKSPTDSDKESVKEDASTTATYLKTLLDKEESGDETDDDDEIGVLDESVEEVGKRMNTVD